MMVSPVPRLNLRAASHFQSQVPEREFRGEGRWPSQMELDLDSRL